MTGGSERSDLPDLTIQCFLGFFFPHPKGEERGKTRGTRQTELLSNPVY